jgi:hypothetical protein
MHLRIAGNLSYLVCKWSFGRYQLKRLANRLFASETLLNRGFVTVTEESYRDSYARASFKRVISGVDPRRVGTPSVPIPRFT